MPRNYKLRFSHAQPHKTACWYTSVDTDIITISTTQSILQMKTPDDLIWQDVFRPSINTLMTYFREEPRCTIFEETYYGSLLFTITPMIGSSGMTPRSRIFPLQETEDYESVFTTVATNFMNSSLSHCLKGDKLVVYPVNFYVLNLKRPDKYSCPVIQCLFRRRMRRIFKALPDYHIQNSICLLAVDLNIETGMLGMQTLATRAQRGSPPLTIRDTNAGCPRCFVDSFPSATGPRITPSNYTKTAIVLVKTPAGYKQETPAGDKQETTAGEKLKNPEREKKDNQAGENQEEQTGEMLTMQESENKYKQAGEIQEKQEGKKQTKPASEKKEKQAGGIHEKQAGEMLKKPEREKNDKQAGEITENQPGKKQIRATSDKKDKQVGENQQEQAGEKLNKSKREKMDKQ